MPVPEGIIKSTLARLLKIFIFLSLLAVFNSFLQVFVIFQNQEIKQLQSEIKLLEKDVSRTKVEIAALGSFDRIHAIALNELGMRAANTDDYQWIEALPVADVPDWKADLQDITRINLWGRMYGWVEDIGKTMAQSI